MANLPDGALKLHELNLVVYLNDEGMECFWWDWVDGESPSISHAVGLIEMLKLHMLEVTANGQEDE